MLKMLIDLLHLRMQQKYYNRVELKKKLKRIRKYNTNISITRSGLDI